MLAGLANEEFSREREFLDKMPVASCADEASWLLDVEDGFVELVGKLVVSFVAKRQRRLLYLTHGWPH